MEYALVTLGVGSPTTSSWALVPAAAPLAIMEAAADGVTTSGTLQLAVASSAAETVNTSLTRVEMIGAEGIRQKSSVAWKWCRDKI